MIRTAIMLIGLSLGQFCASGCGLDWTLPQAHFDGVDEHGHVAYWEKIGEADLGAGLVIPVNINFNSNRESCSPYLGKGWLVALLESHVEPLDENSMRVIMPDGWNFYFYRNGNTETWRGNAGWVGETNNTLFTICAPCGWKIKFDGGKIQEINGENNLTLSYRYNGNVATEVDEGDNPIVQVQSNPATGAPSEIVIAGHKLMISLAQRPIIETMLNQNLLTGFDPSLNALQWQDGKVENFVFGTDKDLSPNLAISQKDGEARTFTWDATTRQIKLDGNWSYKLQPVAGGIRFCRTTPQGQFEVYEDDAATGLTIEKSLTGREISTYRFVTGPMAGRIRKIEEKDNKSNKTLYSASYFPSGNLMREIFYPNHIRLYSDDRQLVKDTLGNKVIYEQDYDNQNRLTHILNPAKEIEVKRTYNAQGVEVTQVFAKGQLLYTEQTDQNNNLVSFNKGTP